MLKRIGLGFVALIAVTKTEIFTGVRIEPVWPMADRDS